MDNCSSANDSIDFNQDRKPNMPNAPDDFIAHLDCHIYLVHETTESPQRIPFIIKKGIIKLIVKSNSTTFEDFRKSIGDALNSHYDRLGDLVIKSWDCKRSKINWTSWVTGIKNWTKTLEKQIQTEEDFQEWIKASLQNLNKDAGISLTMKKPVPRDDQSALAELTRQMVEDCIARTREMKGVEELDEVDVLVIKIAFQGETDNRVHPTSMIYSIPGDDDQYVILTDSNINRWAQAIISGVEYGVSLEIPPASMILSKKMTKNNKRQNHFDGPSSESSG